MIANRSAPSATIVPILVYEDVGKALELLSRAFGFTERLRAEWGGSISHAQMDIGSGSIMLGKQGGPFTSGGDFLSRPELCYPLKLSVAHSASQGSLKADRCSVAT